MTMQTFAITLAAVVLGSKPSAIATPVYPRCWALWRLVLVNFSGGIDKFVGPTGGFLISFPIMAYIIGLGVDIGGCFLAVLSPWRLSWVPAWSTISWVLSCS